MSKRVRFYIEGGAIGREADQDFRRGWKRFLNELHELARGNGYQTLEVIRGQGRSRTYNRFVNHRREYPNDLCVLLVDSETSVPNGQSVWDVVRNRTGDGWVRPAWATERHLYLMVHFVETWLLTDVDALKEFFGRDFDPRPLPSTNLEGRSKDDINRALEHATRQCGCGVYRHVHAHRILEKMKPSFVETLSHGERLFSEMRKLIQGLP